MVRIKNRFILAEIMLPPSLGRKSQEAHIHLSVKDIQNAIREKIKELYGDIGVGDLGNSTVVKYFDRELSHIFILRTLRENQIKVHFAISCINKIKDVDLTIRTIVIKSCPRTCQEGFLELYQGIVLTLSESTEEEKKEIFESMHKSIKLLEF